MTCADMRSLGIAIPVLSAAACDVCPVPTSLFSAHTKFPTFYMHDTTPILNDYLDAWAKEGIELDAIYSGFLGSAAQVGVIQRLYREHPTALRVVDPVMGDGGKMYPTYTVELCEKMRELVAGADILTPTSPRRTCSPACRTTGRISRRLRSSVTWRS